MKVLIILGGQVFSGAEITTLRFAAALPDSWEIEILAHSATCERVAKFGLPAHPWDNESANGDTLLRASHFINEPCHSAQPARKRLDELIHKFRPNAVLACMFPVAMLSLPILQKRNVPLFVHHQLMYKDMPEHPITEPVRRVANYAKCIIAASLAVNEPLKRAKILNTEVITAGLPTNYGQEKNISNNKTIRILSIATWGPQKGLKTLLEADRMLRTENLDYVLTIAGPLNTYSQEYETSMRKLAHPDVSFIGNQPDPRPCYQNADILIIPSSDPDPYPTVTLEGMAHALAVIATDCGGLSEQVINGETGLLVPPNNSLKMAGAIRQLSSDVLETLAMGTAGKKRTLKIANIKHQAAQLGQLMCASGC